MEEGEGGRIPSEARKLWPLRRFQSWLAGKICGRDNRAR